MSAATFVLLCFFLPWVQVSCLGVSDSASGRELARGGEQNLWLIPLSMIAVVVLGFVRTVWERMPAIFSLCGMVGGGLSAYLFYHERLSSRGAPELFTAHMTIWYWLGLVASLVVAGAALWYYAGRARSP